MGFPSDVTQQRREQSRRFPQQHEEHTWDETKDSAFGNLSEHKYSSNVFILTELVIDLNAEKGRVSFMIFLVVSVVSVMK